MRLTNFLSNKYFLYWMAQLLGWAVYMVLLYYTNPKLHSEENVELLMIGLYCMSILETHFFRWVLIRFNWFRFRPVKILLLTVLACILLGVFDEFMDMVMEYIIMDNKDIFRKLTLSSGLISITLSSIFFIMWSAIYFAFHFVGKIRQQEIKAIQYEASKTEIELKNLKSQLNPHFMFNSMNSIRALIDEDPSRAKFAITQLSSILRSTLLMGKNRTVSLRDELNIVKDYLSLEGIRYEERLNTTYKVDERILDCEIPPLMIQTLVENAIKHGISKLTSGGNLTIAIGEKEGKVQVRVENSGDVNLEGMKVGIGLRNTRKRLELLYGDEANFHIQSVNGLVETKITIPKIIWHESNNSR